MLGSAPVRTSGSRQPVAGNENRQRSRLQIPGGCHHIHRMCGRYVSILPAEARARLFGTTGPLPNLEPTWNMAPTKDTPIARFDPETGERRLEVAKWRLVPFFTKDLAKARKPINARSERGRAVDPLGDPAGALAAAVAGAPPAPGCAPFAQPCRV